MKKTLVVMLIEGTQDDEIEDLVQEISHISCVDSVMLVECAEDTKND